MLICWYSALKNVAVKEGRMHAFWPFKVLVQCTCATYRLHAGRLAVCKPNREKLNKNGSSRGWKLHG